VAFSCIWFSSCGLALQLCVQDLVRVSVHLLEMCGPIGEELSTPVESFSVVQQHYDSFQHFILCGVLSFCCVSSSVFLIFLCVTHQCKIKQLRMSSSRFGYCSDSILQVLPLKPVKETFKMYCIVLYLYCIVYLFSPNTVHMTVDSSVCNIF
jgi:hypothetical protein